LSNILQMPTKKLLLNSDLIKLTIQRLCHQLIENHKDFSNSALLGLQPRGVFFADKIKMALKEIANVEVPLGYLDVTFHRDDFRRGDEPLSANKTEVDFIIEDKKIILVDDVLYTGRTIRAAMDAMMAFGRPVTVELLTMIDRKYTRELPIEAKYIGKQVDSLQSQKVKVEWIEQGFKTDSIFLLTTR